MTPCGIGLETFAGRAKLSLRVKFVKKIVAACEVRKGSPRGLVRERVRPPEPHHGQQHSKEKHVRNSVREQPLLAPMVRDILREDKNLKRKNSSICLKKGSIRKKNVSALEMRNDGSFGISWNNNVQAKLRRDGEESGKPAVVKRKV